MGVSVTGRKPHVVVVGHRVSDQIFGAERSLLDVLATIDRKTYEVSCVLPRVNAEYVSAVAGYTSSVHVFSYNWWNQARPVDEEVVSRFEAIFCRERADLVHVNTITLMEPLVAARRVGIPSILHARELITEAPELADSLGGDGAGIARTICAAADFVIANSDATHRLYRKEGRSFRVYNGIDVDRFDLPNELRAGTLSAGIISNNQRNKGIDHFIRLAALASRRRPELEFVVIGPRNLGVTALERGTRRIAPSVNLSLLDYVADPLDAIRRVNVVVSFSRVAESFGRTIVEAMAARRPVIAYDKGALPELVRHEVDGFLIPHLDFAQALHHLEALADDPERALEMGRNARRRAQLLFSRAVFGSQLNAIYRRVIERWNPTEASATIELARE